MPRSRDAKQIKKVKQLRKQFDVSKEIDWLIECSETLAPKSLVVAAWTLAAGAAGITACDIAQASGLTKQVCSNALEDMVDDELAAELSGGRFISSLVAQPESSHNEQASNSQKGTSSSFACFSSSSSSLLPSDLSKDLIGTKSPLLVPSTKSGFLKKRNCKEKVNENTESAADSVPSSSATCCVTNLEPEFKEEKTSKNKKESSNSSKKLVLKESNKNSSPENPKLVKRKLRKLSSPRSKFRADLISEGSKPNGVNAVTKPDYRKNPSQHPDLNNWSQRANPNKWRNLDWVGYWLHKYRNRYSVEDPHFVGLTVYRVMKRAKERNKGSLDAYWYTALQIKKLADSDRGFGGDWKELKEYIDWLLDKYVVENDWLDGPVMAKQIFRVTNNHFLEKFKVRNVKPKGLKKKGKGKRHHWGYDPNG